VRDADEAEDVMQDAYVRAYQHLGQFEGRAPFVAWLTQIAVREALARLRRMKRFESLDLALEEKEQAMEPETNTPDPEETASQEELRRILESAVMELPEHYRAVLMLRDVEELSTAETAEALSLTEENVKMRLHRGRALMR